MSVSIVFFVIVALAFLIILGTVLYGIVLAAADAIGSLITDARIRLSSKTSSARQLGPTPTDPTSAKLLDTSRAAQPDLSADALWHRMQGTSKKSHWRKSGR